jgi:acylphosphatase
MERLHIIVSGSVQGVFFRAGTQDEARRLNLSGWVRNLPDGSVEIEAQGERPALEALLSWCGQGPAGASVSKLVHEWLEPGPKHAGFRIRYD